MKKELTQDQSLHLLELGVSKEMASKIDNNYYPIPGNKFNIEIIPIFTFTDLIEILPKEIEGKHFNHHLSINFGCDMPEAEHDIWFAYYDDLNDMTPPHASELIDALYELVCWYYSEYKKEHE